VDINGRMLRLIRILIVCVNMLFIHGFDRFRINSARPSRRRVHGGFSPHFPFSTVLRVLRGRSEYCLMAIGRSLALSQSGTNDELW